MGIDGFGCCALYGANRIYGTYGTNTRVSDIVCLCRRRVRYGSVEGSVAVLSSGITTILRKLAAEDFATDKLPRHYAIRRHIKSLPAGIVCSHVLFLYSRG